MDVLEHHDRIVDDQADRQHEAEQGQHVDRVAKRIHHDEGRNDRYRDRDGRDQGGAQATEKSVDHREHGEEGEHHGDQDFAQRRLDCNAVVDVDGERHARRQCCAQPLDRGTHAVDDIERVGFRLRLDRYANAGLAVGADH